MISAKPNTPMATMAKSMPSCSSGTPKSKRATPELTSVPTMPQQAQDDHGDGLGQRARGQHHGAHQAQAHQREVFGGTELEGDFGQRGAKAASSVATQPAKNEPRAAIARGGAGAAVTGHLVSVQHGHHRGGFPGSATRMAVVDPPYWAP